MNKVTLFLVFIIFSTATVAEAQFRKDIDRADAFTGAVIKTDPPAAADGWMGALNMRMSHSYSMSFGSFGGQYQNLNAYTNHMFFDLSDRMTGQLDVSLLHSPFGSSYMTNNSNGMGTRVLIDNARLDYQLSSNSRISLQFSQRPYYSSPYGRYGNPYSGLNSYWH